MAKSKKYKLQKPPETYSPIIGIMGGKYHTDYMKADYGTKMPFTNEQLNPKSKGWDKTRKLRNMFTKNN